MQLTVKEVAQLLNVPEKTVYRWIKLKTIPFHCLNEEYRFQQAEILEWATAHQIPVSHEVFAGGAGTEQDLPRLADALHAGGIAYQVAGSDKPALLRAVVQVMRLPGNVDRDHLYEVLLARESLGSTAIGEGIAIPHVRNPIVLHIHQPIVTLCFLAQPIDFDALDGKPVSILFALICPTIRAHLHLLSHLSFILQNPEFKEALQRRSPPEELFALLARLEANLPESPPSGTAEAPQEQP